jgi:hypothetical protein
MPAESDGWVSRSPGSGSEQTAGQRQVAERRRKAHEEARGALLAIVEVRVYEHREEPQVSFPPGAALALDSDPAAVAAVVARARDELSRWR